MSILITKFYFEVNFLSVENITNNMVEEERKNERGNSENTWPQEANGVMCW